MKILIIAAMSADGKIAESVDQLSLDWTSKEDTRFFIDKTKEVGTLVMGSTTFATIGKPLPGRRIIVLSKDDSKEPRFSSIETVPPGGSVEFANKSAEELVADLGHEGVESLVVGGGSSVYSQFLQAGLVTDLYLTIEPVLFGAGIPLASGFDRIEMSLVDVTKLNDQAVLLHYQV
ncbi:MAG: dihydrofolate reductase [Parcubacteria group bacterium]|nr:dihydrofolate reductase [Parcubacteria group bacterium]